MTSKVLIRILCLILCLTVILPSVSALAETTKVAAYLLRLREKPSGDAKVLDAYPRGTKVTILKKGATWTRVRVHEKTGYMRTDMLAYGRYKKVEEESASASSKSSKSSGSSSAAVVSGDTAYVIKGVKLNLREEASSGGDIIASFRGGTKVTVIKKGRYWSQVEVQGLVGYMANEYLTAVKED